MFKQLLTYALAATLALEAPATAYVAEQQMSTVAASVQEEPNEGITDIPSSSGQPDSTEVLEGSGENGVVAPEDNAGNEIGEPEDGAGNESGSLGNNTGNETGTPEDNTGNESDAPENNGENGTGSSEENGGNTANPSEDGDGNGDDSPEEIDGEEADISEALEGEEELNEAKEDVDAEETAEKEASLDLTQTKGVTLVQVTGGTNEDNVYDIVRTFQAKALDSETTLADAYYLRLNYSADGNNYVNMGNIQLTSDDNYQAVVYSAAMSNIWYNWLQPDTDYYLEWELAESSDGKAIAAIYEIIHTKPATVDLAVEKNGYNQQTFKVTMAAEDVVHMKENNRSTDWVVYMKKADEGDYHKLNNYCSFGEHNDYSYTLMLPNLEPETTYNLSLRDYNGSFEYAKTTFTTQADQRALSDDQTKVSDTDASVKFKAYFSGNNQNMSTYTPSYILFFYKQQTNSEWILADSISVGETSQYCITTVGDLSRGTKYDYAIVLSDDNKVSTPDRVTKEGWKLTGEFTTPKAVAPASVSLSESKFYLNAAFPSDEGYGCQVLKVTSNPAVATKDYIWTSSDESVARVSNGKVTAVGPGTATITVTSLYSNESGECASATCEVEVADYRVGYENGSALFFWEGVQLSKGKLLAGSLELYQFDKAGKYEKVPAVNYNISSNNTQIVSINGRYIRTGSVGTTKLVFTTGEFRSYVYWSTVANVKGFDILGLASEHSSYPAIENGKGSYTLAKDITYMARGEVGPSVYGDSESYFEPSDYIWTSSNPNVAAVNNYGEIMALAVGTATITVKANPETASQDGWAVLDGKSVTLTLNVTNRPDTEYTELYALANTQTTLRDVKAPDGWQWKDEDLSTPLVTNGVNTECYAFDAIYSKEGYYPCETTFNIYIANVTGMSAYDDHDQVVEVKNSNDVNADTMNLTVKTNYQGTLKADEYIDYTVDIPAVNGLDIKPDTLSTSGSRTFAITATKAGTYTLKPTITVKDKIGNTKQLAQTSYKIKAVADKQVKSIEIKPLTDHIDGIGFDKARKRISIDLPSENEVGVSAVKTPDQFEVEAVVKDRYGEVLEAAQLIWKSSDQKVAAVKASADTMQKATVTIQGEGHAILTATAKDTAGRSAKLQIEIRNHAPRVDVAKVTVNTAYDYNNYYGRELAYYSSGKIEIVPVYDEHIYSGDVAVYEKDAVSTKLSAYRYSDNEWVIGSKGNIEPGTYNCELRVTVSGSGLIKARIYKYPLKVTVINKRAVIKAKALNTVNLFYTSEGSRMYLSISGTYRQDEIQNALWEDESPGNGNGFVYNGSYDCRYAYKAYSFSLDQERIDLIPKGKSYTLADTGIAKGKLKVWLYGYKDIYEVPISIKWKYKKPTIVTKEAGTTLVPSAKMNRNGFYLYNKTEKEEINYGANVTSWEFCQEIKCDNEDVDLTPSYYSSYCSYIYSGSRTSGNEKIKLTLSADHWREPLTAVHTMKMAAPTACLTESQVTLNTTQMGTTTTDIYLKNNGYFLSCDDIGIEGKDAKAKKLLDNDSLVVTGYGSRITVRQNRASTMGQEAIKAGTYTYQVTPYYTDADGVRRAMNVLTLKVKVVNKAITATTKTKGTLDLTNAYAYGGAYENCVELTPVFSSIGSNYRVTKADLVGEYSKYFTLYHSLSSGYCRLRVADYGELKAGQKYKLAVKYTIQMPDGDTFTVIGKTFTVKPKQTAPKVTVINNNQTLYAAADGMSRIYTLQLSGCIYKEDGYEETYYPYIVENVRGSLDCNKDGKPDFKVSLRGSGDDSDYYLAVEIIDRDGVLTITGGKGKTYSIPIMLELRGRDGTSKDVKTTIKVTVKR